MPEGDTVYRTARLLDRSLSGQVLTRTDFRVPQLATIDLAGGTVVETVSRGKHLLTRVDGTDGDRWTLHTHLKMERTRVEDVPDLPRLVRRARQMLDINKERATQSTTGDLREPMWVYRRDRSACRRCGTPIAVEMAGPLGRERAAYWCPRCQPSP